jgi:hypothetical protein
MDTRGWTRKVERKINEFMVTGKWESRPRFAPRDSGPINPMRIAAHDPTPRAIESTTPMKGRAARGWSGAIARESQEAIERRATE